MAMEFTFETVYDQKAITAMAKALRKTIGKKRSRRVHIFGWTVVVLDVLFTLLTLPWDGGEWTVDFGTLITWLAGLTVLIILLFEDKLNAYISRKRLIAGTDKAVSVFGEDGYTSVSGFGKSEFRYENIVLPVETDDYFVFLFDRSHGQIYDKSTLSGGTAEEFRHFLSQKTGKEIVRIEG